MALFTKYSEIFRGLRTIKRYSTSNRKKRDKEVQKSEMILFVKRRVGKIIAVNHFRRGGEKYITIE